MHSNIWFWVAFNLFVLVLLTLDLGVFNRRAHAVGMREALLYSAGWIALSLLFNLGIWYFFGPEPALQFLTGYLIEKSLSVDNLFVIALIFSYFSVPAKYQHKVLFWGILGALIMRATLIILGTSIINRFHFAIYIFGAFLVLTGIRMAFQKESEIEPDKNPLVKLFRKFFPVTSEYHEGSFFIRQAGKLVATPLFVVVLVVEATDLVFAVDSIPAIFGVTTDPFIVYTSNVFAILGLRSLYFALASIIVLFRFLKIGLSLILVFIGMKMVLAGVIHIPIGVALGVVATILIVSIVLSILRPAQDPPAAPPT